MKPCNHDAMGPKLGYVAWHEWAVEQRKRGKSQKQCKRCGLWLFPCERRKHAPAVKGEGVEG